MSVSSKMRAIADAIRSKTGETAPLTLDGMAAAISTLDKSQIIVTAPAGSSVTASMGAVTKTAAEKSGTWTFRGCDVGLWTIKAVKNAQNAVKTVEIKTAGQLMRYPVTLSYFAATITVVYPAGAVCTCSNGSTVLTAPDTSGFYTFTVQNAGPWTVKAVQGGNLDSKVISVTEQKAYSAALSFALWLIQKGNLAGLVAVDDSVTVTQGTDGVKFEGTITGDKFISATVDLTEYTSMVLSGLCQTNKSYQFLHVWDAGTTTLSRTNSIAKVELTETGAVMDVSQYHGSYIVGFCVRNVKEYVHTISDWYLTK